MEWISVEDKLPEDEYELWWICINGKHVGEGRYSGGFWWTRAGAKLDGKLVTHWWATPISEYIPEPPKSKDKEEEANV